MLLGEWVYRPYSILIKMILRRKGIHVGSNFYVQGIPKLKIRGEANNIVIGNNVSINGDIDIRNRENGKIIIKDNVAIDHGCRLVVANDATLCIGDNARIGLYTVFNCGEDVFIDNKCLISGFCYIQSSNHGIKKGAYIQDQNHTYGKITIGPDTWLASHVTVLPGVNIKEGAVVGAKAVVTKDIPSFDICAGIPASKVGKRS